MQKLTLVADNLKPDKPAKVRRSPKVSPYCPECGGNTWFAVNQGPADRTDSQGVLRLRCCVHCMSKGRAVTW